MLLTKSKYLAGLQCSKYLWALFHDKEKIPKPDEAAQFMFDEGTRVGELATELYPKGIDLSKEDFKSNLIKPSKAL